MSGSLSDYLRAHADLLAQAADECDQAQRERDNACASHEGQRRNTLAFMREAEERKELLLKWLELLPDDPDAHFALQADTRKALGL